jgi:membrane protein DedA with SNARE-associated domain
LPFPVDPNSVVCLVSAATRLFQRKGVWVVLTARFVVLLRQLNGLVAGSMRMHFPRFLMANAAGAALWVIIWVFIGYTFGHEAA